MKRFIVGSNWKMNSTVEESLSRIDKIEELLGDFKAFPIFILPPFTSLDAVSKRLQNRWIKFGAQNMHWETAGAYTGEISAPMLKELGCKYVMLNHQERRVYFNETNRTSNAKLHTAFSFMLQPILCIGEEDRASFSKTKNFLEHQLSELLDGLKPEEIGRILFAYEPLWAIGESEAAPADYIEQVHKIIRDKLSTICGPEIAKKTFIIYGGSVDLDNALDIALQTDVDGLFIGRAGLEPEKFVTIIKAVYQSIA
ncbi:Triosephosphate isomerase [Moorella thermoacetica]|uniref:Triosephosphate isomerase n=1 Tax=Neomoorella thermoacetica TaxID=1525 RepID=A0AAC9MTJ8_NEOTH|nr:triose-phosphate isomerase [Moorella thermoacetica]AOQ22742.1 Triosephosphate isomerase [Moorella thermoacetica]TYL06835.1 Triosephosphate isomerase [Moorella thermoacetica]